MGPHISGHCSGCFQYDMFLKIQYFDTKLYDSNVILMYLDCVYIFFLL